MDSKRIGKLRVYFYSIENLTEATFKDKLYANSEALDFDGIASSRTSVFDNKVQHDTDEIFSVASVCDERETLGKLPNHRYNGQESCSVCSF